MKNRTIRLLFSARSISLQKLSLKEGLGLVNPAFSDHEMAQNSSYSDKNSNNKPSSKEVANGIHDIPTDQHDVTSRKYGGEGLTLVNPGFELNNERAGDQPKPHIKPKPVSRL